MWFRRRATPKKQIAVPIRLAGVPPQYPKSIGVRSRLEFPDGSFVQSAQGDTVTVPRDSGDQSVSDHMAPVRAALQPASLLAPLDDPRSAQWPVVLTVTADDYERYGRTPGRLTATVEAFLHESRLVGSIPLVEGAVLQALSARFELRRVRKRSDGCSVLIRQVAATGRPNVSRSYQYFLRNAQRAEAVPGENQQIMFHSMPFRFLPLGGWSFDVPFAAPFGFLDHAQSYSSRTTRQIDADWIAGADLAVIETAYAGRVSRSLVIEGFRMRN